MKGDNYRLQLIEFEMLLFPVRSLFYGVREKLNLPEIKLKRKMILSEVRIFFFQQYHIINST